MSKLYTGIVIILVVFIIFVMIIDYSLYADRTNLIKRGLDYSISAAVQEIDTQSIESIEGLSQENDEEKGLISLKGVKLNEEKAIEVFFSTLKHNTNIDRSDIEDKIMIIMTYDTGTHINYKIKKGDRLETGEVTAPEKMQDVINLYINEFWPVDSNIIDKHTIFVNGNTKVNEFKNSPSFMIFIKDYQINGLFNKRTATIVAFKRAKVERVVKTTY